MIDYNFCVSSYLAFRYVAKFGIGWREGVVPEFPNTAAQGQFKVKTASDVLNRLQSIVQELPNTDNLGVLLSSGMDSTIIAALMPRGTRAYTIRFIAKGAIDEAPGAVQVAEQLGLQHTVVSVGWDDYDENMDALMKRKKSPLHPAEVGLYMAACAARQDGVTQLVVGNGADSTFGGLDKLLSKDWTFEEFVSRYMFLDPSRAVKHPISMLDIFEPYRTPQGVNVSGFLKSVHGLGVIQMFENAIHSGGCSIVAPFEELSLDVPLDIQRIRSGEPKYILNEVFQTLCPGLEIRTKIPFARPVTQWLSDWQGPKHPAFLDNLSMSNFSGEQKWQLYCLERFLNLVDQNAI